MHRKQKDVRNLNPQSHIGYKVKQENKIRKCKGSTTKERKAKRAKSKKPEGRKRKKATRNQKQSKTKGSLAKPATAIQLMDSPIVPTAVRTYIGREGAV